MAETKPIPVRLGDEMIARLDKASTRIGNNRAGLIRFLVESWLDQFEKKGMTCLPTDWEELMQALDNRTRASRDVAFAEGGKTPEHPAGTFKSTSYKGRRRKPAGPVSSVQLSEAGALVEKTSSFGKAKIG